MDGRDSHLDVARWRHVAGGQAGVWVVLAAAVAIAFLHDSHARRLGWPVYVMGPAALVAGSLPNRVLVATTASRAGHPWLPVPVLVRRVLVWLGKLATVIVLMEAVRALAG